MGKQKPDKLKERSIRAFAERDANRSTYEDVYELYSPYRNTLTSRGNTLNKPTRQYDSTGPVSAANFVNTITGGFTPPFTKWSKLQAGPGVPKDQRETLNTSLENITDIFYSYLNASNFATASSEMYFEWGIGTGCLWLHEGDELAPFNFIASPISELGIAEGKNDTVDFRCRKREVEVRLLKELWPDATIPETLDMSTPERKVEVVECFYFDYEDIIWRYDVLVEDACIYNTVHQEEICMTPRWLKIPGHTLGVGPFIFALPDVKTQNKLKEFLLRSAALDVAGVYTIAGDGAINANNVNIAPNTFIPVERNSGENGPTISRLDTSSNFQLQEYMVQGLTDQIRKTLLDNRLPAETAQPKTAFEVAQRMREFQIDIGSAYGRGYFEYILPLWKRGLSILAKKGLIQLPEGFTIDNIFIQVQVTSAVAQTQQADEVQRFMQAYQMVQAINPELALTSYKVEEIPVWLTEMLGTPSRLLRDEAEREQMVSMIAQQAAQQQQQPQ